MKYFGPPGDAPVYEEIDRGQTPVGEKCFVCAIPIALGDQGFLIPHIDATGSNEVPWHRTCFLEEVLGPLARLS